jgi:type IV pilus assembly protein PilF
MSRETTMKLELRRLAGMVALAAAQLALLALIGGCAAPAATTPAPPRQPDPPPPIKTQEASPKDRAALHAELGAGYYERGRMDVAIEELTEAQQLDPTNPKIYNYFALVYTVLGDNPKAEQNFQRALQLAPQDPEVRHNWGWYLCSNDRPKESIPEFEAALRDPFYKTPEVALTNAGRCSAAFGDYANADAFYRRALARSPTNAPALYGLALLAYRAGRYDEARGYTRRLAQLPQPAPEALFLGMCVERKAGDRAAETLYVTQLRNRYPDSLEAKSIATGICE